MKHQTFHPDMQRGVSLVEALVALVVMAFGMLAVIGTQATLRVNSDTAKQRSEAVRIAQREIERRRSFSALNPSVENPTAYSDIAQDPSDQTVSGPTNTSYSVRHLLPGTKPSVFDANSLRELRVVTKWSDRQGNLQQVELSTVIAGTDPAMSGYLSLALGSSRVDTRGGAGGKVPLHVKDLGDGTSAYKPSGIYSVALRFSNGTGMVSSICTVAVATTNDIRAEDLTNCTAVTGYIVTGWVRFAQDPAYQGALPLSAEDAETPRSPLVPLAVRLHKTPSDSTSNGTCFTDTVPAEPSLRSQRHDLFYVCMVPVSALGSPWSGWLTADLLEGGYGTDADTLRLCRYSADYNKNSTIENEEHPDVYTSVNKHLANQNFLLVPGLAACPADVDADPDNGDFVNANTLQVMPRPAP